MDDGFDVEKFISLVKAKDSIWNYKSKAYGSKTQRKQDWISICAIMIEDFEEKTSSQKIAIALEFQSRWKVLRDGFTRSIKNYKKKQRSERNLGKLYTYYTQLEFLNDLYEDKIYINDDTGSSQAKQEKNKKRAKTTDDIENVSQVKKSCIDRNASSTNSNDYELDEDKHFLLSLLSDFRKISEDQKLDAKGDIINVIRHYRNMPLSQFQTPGNYYSNDIAALATTATERPNSRSSSCYEDIAESSRGNSPTEIKFVSS